MANWIPLNWGGTCSYLRALHCAAAEADKVLIAKFKPLFQWTCNSIALQGFFKAEEVQSLRSGPHKWEFTHTQLTLLLPFEWTHQQELHCLTHLPFLYHFVNANWKQRWQLRPAIMNFGSSVSCLPWPQGSITHQAPKSIWTRWHDRPR